MDELPAPMGMGLAMDERMSGPEPEDTAGEGDIEMVDQEFEEVDVSNGGGGSESQGGVGQGGRMGSPQLWTRELEGDDSEFLEVVGSRRT